MDLKKKLSFPPYPGDYLHPVVYACTAVMLLCLLISVMTYIIHHSVIRISRKGWHILMNVLLHTAMVFGVFAGGINQIKYPTVCRVVGIILHYSSVSTMLWLTLTASNTCNEISKAVPVSQNMDRPAQTHSKFTIFRFYLFGSGIPILIVGVTAAVNLDNYGSRNDAHYCWVAWEPSMGGFFGPAAFLVLVLCTYFLCTFVQLKRHPERKYELKAMTEEQQRLATSEIGQCHAASREPGEEGDHSRCMAINASMLANEHSFKAQLWTTAFTVFLFLATWASGALAMSQGHYPAMIFSCLYGAFSVTLGLFLLIQHCAKRDDVWHRWWACCPSKPKLDVNGEAAGSTQIKSHIEARQPYASKPLLSSESLTSSPQCTSRSLPTAQPMSLCCSTLNRSTLLLKDSEHSLSLPDELPRHSLPLQSCLKDRTKSCSVSQPRLCLRDYSLHVASTSLDGSVQSSHLDSPHSMHLEDPSTCVPCYLDSRLSCQSPHLDKQLCCSSPSTHMEIHRNHLDSQLLCLEGHTCHRHMSCAKAEHCSSICCSKTHPFSGASHGVERSKDSLLHSTKMTKKEDDIILHLDIPSPQVSMTSSHATLSRKSTFSQREMLSHDSSLHEDYVFSPDSKGNIKTGPWKNETTV